MPRPQGVPSVAGTTNQLSTTTKGKEQVGLFRRNSRRWQPEVDYRAVPLTPQEVEVLVTGFTEDDRLTRRHRPDIGGGSGYCQNEAVGVMRDAALAASLGHDSVPYRVTSLHMLQYVTGALRNWAPQTRHTEAFALLELKLHALSAVAVRNNWRYELDHEARAIRWATPPALAMVKAIECGGGR